MSKTATTSPKMLCCPACHSRIETQEDIKYQQEGWMTYKLSVVKKEVKFDFDEFDSDDSGEWLCANCGFSLDLNFEEGCEFYLHLKE